MPTLFETHALGGPADIILSVASGYVGLGLLFASAFLTRGVRQLDPAAAGMPLAVRVLILPATVALWPLLAARWARARRAGTRA